MTCPYCTAAVLDSAHAREHIRECPSGPCVELRRERDSARDILANVDDEEGDALRRRPDQEPR